MSITINRIEFDHHSYDERGDVLYLSVGEPRVPAETDATPEGHAVDFDAAGKNESPRDRIAKISRPYLQFSIID